jgi:hypothetical protein
MNTSKIDLFGGTGFIGSYFKSIYKDEVYIHPKKNYQPISDNILYMISTVDNYNVYKDLHLDIDTNLKVLMNVLNFCKDKN